MRAPDRNDGRAGERRGGYQATGSDERRRGGRHRSMMTKGWRAEQHAYGVGTVPGDCFRMRVLTHQLM